MDSIQPFEGKTRVAKAEDIQATSESVYAVAKAIDESNDMLDDLNEGLKMLKDKHEVYKIKAQRAKKMMRSLSVEL